jgi:hypothetical protein
MGDEIDDVKNTIESFVDKLEEDELEYQLALVEFKDFPESTCGGTFSGVSDFSERVHEIPPSSGDVFTTEVTEYKKVVESIITGGGADFPESHLAAIDSAITNLNFRSDSEKFIIMLTDAMPHAVDCICPISIYGCVPVTATEGHTSPPCNKGPDSVEVMRDRLEGKFKFYYINKEDIFSTCLNRIMKDDLTPATGGKFYSYTEAEGVNDIILDLADEINKVYAEKISHLKIIFYSDTESEEIQIPSSELPGPLEKRKYELEIAPPIADVKRVEIYSVFVTPSGKQVVGPPLDIINVEGLG